MKNSKLPRFLRKEDGGLSVEACFAIPMLIWVIVAMIVFFDAFKQLNISQKATYAVADMISREEAAVNDDYITALHEAFIYLSGERGPSAIRVSVVEMTVDEDTGDEVLELVWSEGRMYDDLADLEPIRGNIPTLSPGEQLIVVESVQGWVPPFGVGLAAAYRFREVALARPRFSPKICWETLTGCVTTGT